MTDGHDDVTVVIVDDEELFRSGLAMILGCAAGVRVLGSTESERALEMVRSCTPDVVLVDIPSLDRKTSSILAGLEEIKRFSRVVILTAVVDAGSLRTAVLLGASALLGKDIESAHLVRCIAAAASGGFVLSVGIEPSLLIGPMTSIEDAGLLDQLSDRERAVLAGIVADLSNDQIARECRLSRSIVKDSVRCILLKLGVSSRVGAAVWAVRAGLTSA